MKRGGKSLSSSLEHGLSSYALAASAAGVSLLALTQPAEGKIIYTHAHKFIGPRTTVPIDLNHDGVRDFSFRDKLYKATYSTTGILWGVPARHKNQILGPPTSGNVNSASALVSGAKVGPPGPFSAGTKYMARGGNQGGAVPQTNNSVCYGPWPDGVSRFLGLKFDIKGQTHYGWARLKVYCRYYPGEVWAYLTGYAYETIPNKPIIAGKTHGKDVITLEPASLGHLARGASALSTWRTAGANK